MSKNHYFHNIMRKVITQFCDVFNDIHIARYNQQGVVLKYVKVPLKFAPKTKQWYWKELQDNKDRRDQVLPMMAINLENVEYASERQVNRNYKVYSKNDGTDGSQFYNAVPYDLTFNLYIAAEYMVDITQIVEQIFPYFTPEAYIRISVPELRIDGLSANGEIGSDKLELKVLYESSNREANVELDENGYRILLWTLTFKVNSFFFSPAFDVKPIHKVVQNYYLSKGDESTDGVWPDTSGDVTKTIGQEGKYELQGVTSATNIPILGQIGSFTFISTSSGYVDGTEYATTTSGTGTGAKFTPNVEPSGSVLTLGGIVAGTDYVEGQTYATTSDLTSLNVTGLGGSGATLKVLAGNNLEVVNIGSGYIVGEVLTLVGGDNNFTASINTITPISDIVVNGSFTEIGSGYEVNDTVTLTGGSCVVRVDTIQQSHEVDDSVRAMYQYEHYIRGE